MIPMCSRYVCRVFDLCIYAWWSFWFWVSYCSEEYRAFLHTTTLLVLKSVSRTEVKCQEWKTNSSTKMFWWFPLKSDVVFNRKYFFADHDLSFKCSFYYFYGLCTIHVTYIYICKCKPRILKVKCQNSYSQS